jgi:hypothetical protein
MLAAHAIEDEAAFVEHLAEELEAACASSGR